LLTPRSIFDPGDFVFILAKRPAELSKNCKNNFLLGVDFVLPFYSG